MVLDSWALFDDRGMIADGFLLLRNVEDRIRVRTAWVFSQDDGAEIGSVRDHCLVEGP